LGVSKVRPYFLLLGPLRGTTGRRRKRRHEISEGGLGWWEALKKRGNNRLSDEKRSWTCEKRIAGRFIWWNLKDIEEGV